MLWPLVAAAQASLCDDMSLCIATWNINGVKARLPNLLTWLKEASPDIACLQELKSQDAGFPRMEIEELGYNLEAVFQKSFNGVALISKYPMQDVLTTLPGDETDEQSRYIEALINVPSGVVRAVGIYLPNGNPLGTEKFSYKLAWMARLEERLKYLLTLEEPLIVLGDYNVIPEPHDCFDPKAWQEDALFQPQSRQAFQRLLNLGFTDALRACTDAHHVYTFWDYQAGAWNKNNGIRIDHLLLSPQAADRLLTCRVDSYVRAWEKPSDHVPVVADFS